MSKTRLMTAVTIGAAGLLLTGCGSASPGVAARIGDEELSMRYVDSVAAHYCTARGKDLEAAAPMGYVRSYVLRYLTLRSQALQLADDYGVEPSSTYRNAVAQQLGTAGTLPEEVRQDYLDVESATALVQDVINQVGEIVLADQGVADPTTDEVTQAGLDVFNQWPDANGVEFDPRYGMANVDGVISPVDTNTSVAVGEIAKSGLADPPDPAFAESLPATHRCG